MYKSIWLHKTKTQCKTKRYKYSHFLFFSLCDSTCACIVGFFSNPFDVIKTRQQLQGELIARHGRKDLKLKVENQKQPYKNIFQSIRSIVQAEGVRGLQKGLTSALAFQFCMYEIDIFLA